MRSVWKGQISFGLVSIPIAVYPATREDRVSFKQLRKSDLSPIKYKKVAEADEKEVPAKEIVKGYEYEKGKWVTLTEEDLDQVEVESTHSIEITDFVDQKEIDPKFFAKPHYLEAQKGGEKAYALLHKALEESGKIGIAKVAIRSREYLAAVKPDGHFLGLELMHFAAEVLEPEGLNQVTAELQPRELAMAMSLIDSMTTPWDPAKYADRYQDAIRQIIEDKVAARPVHAKSPRPASAGKVVDLLAVLQESLKANTDLRKKPAAGKPAKAREESPSFPARAVKPKKSKAA
jgi:DNA end-binding protein Ku